MLTWLGYIDGKCYHISHTWILWDRVTNKFSRNNPRKNGSFKIITGSQTDGNRQEETAQIATASPGSGWVSSKSFLGQTRIPLDIQNKPAEHLMLLLRTEGDMMAKSIETSTNYHRMLPAGKELAIVPMVDLESTVPLRSATPLGASHCGWGRKSNSKKAWNRI